MEKKTINKRQPDIKCDGMSCLQYLQTSAINHAIQQCKELSCKNVNQFCAIRGNIM